MFSKYKIGEIVIVNGVGKCNHTIYKNKIGIVICRDPYFLDYNIKFIDVNADWIDEKYLKSLK